MRLLLALMLVWLVLAAPAVLAQEHDKGQKNGHAPAAHKEGGSTNPLAFHADQALWAIVVFLLLLGILWKLAWGPMLEGLHRREETIRGSVEEAKKTREEMERLRAQFKAELDSAHAAIPKLMDEARLSAQRMVEEMRVRATEEIQAEKQRGRRELEVARDQALQELWNQAAHLATLISAKAIGRSLSEEDHRRLVDEAVRELGQSNGSRN